MTEPLSQLGVLLKNRRRKRRISLRDLADETGVSFNTLSRVERGHIPDLENFRRIVDWLEVPPETFFGPPDPPSTPHAIARHLLADRRLTEEAANKIVAMVDDMYGKLAAEPLLAVHLRSAKTFTPAASQKLAEVLSDMQSSITSDS